MKGLKSAFAVLCLSTVYASAHAQETGISFSENFFGIYAGSGVYVTSESGDHYNVAGTYSSGSGSFNSAAGGVYGVYSYAVNLAFAGPGAGFAQSGYGFEQFLTFTNENANGQGELFGVYSTLYQLQETTAGGTSTSFGGIQEFGGQYFYGFNTVTLDGLGLANVYAYNWNGVELDTSAGYSNSISAGGFQDYLAFGQSITVGVWSSGIGSATSTGSVPGPAAIAPFAVGLIAAARRRRR